jgi:hypothetical protein
VDADPTSDLCRTIANHCVNPEPSNNEPTCEPVDRSVSPTSCYEAIECTTEISSGGQVLEVLDTHSASCNISGDDWRCSCYANLSGEFYDFTFVDAPSQPCHDANELCAEGAFVVDGPLSCEPESYNANREYCSTQHLCQRSGTAGDGMEIFHNSYVNSECYKSGGSGADTSWNCFCYGEGVDASVELVGADSFAVCLEAADECVSVLE